ncbi:MAG TPA: (deoxy)nucleoside triphosphate pyrophosphohydrolase [Bacteroidales bacterium]|nr:(deoxy)nucleoside triphosphate pyrophosphohydrolase [Bacteroidales bacterium]HPT22311.1 (deoxy)nucleoside triphosphate pyrophosphohydrolase [Bacteroidales bacterium]
MKIFYSDVMINVTCAVIRNEDDEVLIVQRGEATDHPYKWEFPGGKIIPGESDEDCIIREVEEELSMEIVICGRLPEVEYDYRIKQIRLIPFICDTLDELPLLTEHLAYKWVLPEDLGSVDFSEADVLVADSYKDKIGVKMNHEEVTVKQSAQSEPADDDLQAMINNLIRTKEVEWIATSAIENPSVLKKLFEYSYSSDRKLAFHASWALTKVGDRYPEMINPYLPSIIDSLGKLNNDSTQRSFLRILSLCDMNILSHKNHGILADYCFSMLKSGFSTIAAKAYSMEILYKLAIIYPELANELAATIRILQDEKSAGILARGRIIIKKLKAGFSDPPADLSM